MRGLRHEERRECDGADGPEAMARRRGALAHQAGRAAESAVASHYRRLGCPVLAERWRGRGGEIDLVARDGGELVFVEVKRSRSWALAAERVGPRQIARLFAAAAEYVAGEPAGQATPMRFDVALVDGSGRIEVIANALAA
jgi:putative endonuclease